MKFFPIGKQAEQTPAQVGVPILVRVWQEDDVWNASAFDLDVAAFGDSPAEVRKHFEEALNCHFDSLAELGRAKATVERLCKVAAERGFYEDRMPVHEMVSRFEVPAQMEGCYA